MREKTSISSVIGEDLTAFSVLEGDFNGILEEEQSDSMYDSEEDNISQYDQSNQPLHYKEMPTLVCDSKELLHFATHFIHLKPYLSLFCFATISKS